MSEKTQSELARERAIAQAVDTLVYFGLVAAISWAILKRDAVTRLWMRLRYREPPPSEVRWRRMAAEFRRDISRIEHGDGPPPRPKGLYE